MAKKEILALYEDDPSAGNATAKAAQSGDSYLVPRDLATTTGVLISEVADGATADGFVFNTENALSTAGAKIASFQNNGSEQAYIDKDGGITISNTVGPYPSFSMSRAGFSLVQGTGQITMNGEILISTETLKLINISSNLQFGFPDSSTIHRVSKVFCATPVNGNRSAQHLEVLAGNANSIVGLALIDGGYLLLKGGDGTASSAGDAHGGNVTISGGTGYGTGHDGYVLANGTIYGIMSVQANSTSQDDIGTTKIATTAWNTDGVSNGMTVDNTDNSIQATVAGTYEVSVHLSFSGTNSIEYQLEIYVYDDSGTAWGASGFAIDRKLGTGGDVGACSFAGIVALDVDDKVAIYISSENATDDIVITEAQLIAKRISD